MTLSPQEADATTGGRSAGPAAAVPGGGGGRELIQANQSAITDLSKLGKPGTHFVHDFFLPGTQLTFPQSQAKQIATLPGVAAVVDRARALAASTRRARSRRSSPRSRPAASG